MYTYLRSTYILFKSLKYKNLQYFTKFNSSGYGFVEYEDPADAAKAIQQLDKYPIQNKTLKVSYSFPNQDYNLYISELPPETTDESLQQHFSPAGT